jgi:hypothetical protein
MTTTFMRSSLVPARLLMLTLVAALAADACGTSASDATDTSLTAENGAAAETAATSRFPV